jgi:hypothetical protein
MLIDYQLLAFVIFILEQKLSSHSLKVLLEAGLVALAVD